MRVLIVDDHERLRRSLREVLSRTLGAGTWGEAPDAATALRLVDAEPWDLVLLDLSLPNGQGLETLGELRRRRPALPVLVMSMHPEAQFGPAARAAGASGYLPKGSDPETIAAAVRSAVAAPVVAPAPTLPDRHWLSRTLHDDLAQTLSALKMNLHLGATEPEMPAVQRRLRDSIALVEQAIATVRGLMARIEGAS